MKLSRTTVVSARYMAGLPMKVDISVSLSSIDEAKTLAWMVEHIIVPLMEIGHHTSDDQQAVNEARDTALKEIG